MMLENRMVSMSARELRRVEVLSQLQDGSLRVEEAAGIMNVSVRHAYRLLDRFSAGGAKELVHRSRGKQSNRKTSAFRRDYILDLVREHYHDFGPTLAAEMLFERHEIKVSREALRTWMTEADIWLPRKARKRFHQPRLRREYFGELVQIDGSEHRWFEDSGPKCTLLVFIDDATSALLALRFVPSESTQSYFAIFRNYLEQLGRHRSTIFRELKRNFFHDKEVHKHSDYFCTIADSFARGHRAVHRKINNHPALISAITDGLKAEWSPAKPSPPVNAVAAN